MYICQKISHFSTTHNMVRPAEVNCDWLKYDKFLHDNFKIWFCYVNFTLVIHNRFERNTLLSHFKT